MADFEALRLEPYLRFTAQRHNAVKETLIALADEQAATSIALIHGDVSPKNILLSATGPILLDAECATMGDPVFDVAFLLNHLLLKSVHLPALRHSLQQSVRAFWHTYSPMIDWESPTRLEARLVRLLPALMLARIDGKSPVEYLSESHRDHIRSQALTLLATPPAGIEDLLRTHRETIPSHE